MPPACQPSRRSQREFRSSWATICRTTGLSLVTTIRARYTEGEPPKFAIRKSRASAAARATIHLVPLAVAISLIVLNVNTQYYGLSNSWVSVLQFAAKAHEMLMQASITFAVLAYVRRALVSPGGVPFGSMFAGLQCTQISYLWSPEFWASATTTYFQGRRRLTLLTFVPFSVVLAVAVGPSSAIAMIPRPMWFPAGRTQLWLSVPAVAIYPSRIKAGITDPACSAINITGNPDLDCPSDDWQSLETFLRVRSEGYVLPPFPQLTQKFQTNTITRPLYVCDFYPDNPCTDATATTAQQAMVEASVQLVSFWLDRTNELMAFQSRTDSIHKVDAKQPYVATSCTLPFELLNSTSDLVSFTGSSPGAWDNSDTQALDPPLTQADVWASIKPELQGQILWIESSKYNFVNTSLAAIVIYPGGCGPFCRYASSCRIRADWGTGQLNVSSGTSSGELNPFALLPVQSTSFDPTGGANASNFAWKSVDTWPAPLSPIQIDKGWAEFLTPQIVGQNMSVDSALLLAVTTGVGMGKVTIYNAPDPSVLIAMLVCNGIGRSTVQFDIVGLGYPPDRLNASSDQSLVRSWLRGLHPNIFGVTSSQSQGLLELNIASYVEGFGYTMAGFPIKIAVTVLLLYCTYSLVHFLYTSTTGISSNSWDSIAELTALAMNSAPTGFLDHTSAGIAKLDTFRQPVSIRKVDEHLEIVFSDTNERARPNIQKVVKNEIY